MTEEVHFYFAYGSNMNPARVEKRRMKFLSTNAGRLYDFHMTFNKRSVKYPGAASANVIEMAGSVTEGVLYRLTEPAQIEMMDPYEGYPRRYDRRALPVETSDGIEHAWVYIANLEFITEGLNPARWYLEHLLAGREFLSPEYCLRLSETVCMPDSDVEPG